MTIDEAINKYIKLKIFAEATDDKRTKEEHEQLIEWLKELKEYKKNSNTCPMCDTYCSYLAEEFENGYNKAIDDFVNGCEKQLVTMYGQRYIDMRNIKEIAEQLKAGVDNEISGR